jgi:predicted amidophosphoribosyltransferase
MNANFEDNYTRPTSEQLQMFYACRLCGVPMPHQHTICDGCDAEREQSRIDSGEKVACDSCGEETLPNPCNECRDDEEATRL